MAGHEHDDGLVARRDRVERATLFRTPLARVTFNEQRHQGEASGFRLLSLPFDDPVDDFLDPDAGMCAAQFLDGVNQLFQERQAEGVGEVELVDIALIFGKSFNHLGGFLVAGFIAEYRSADDAGGQPGHLVKHVDFRAIRQ